MLVIGGKVIGDVSKTTARTCSRLAAMARTNLLRIDLAVQEHPSDAADSPGIFIAADPCPAINDPSALLQLVQYIETLPEAGVEGIST